MERSREAVQRRRWRTLTTLAAATALATTACSDGGGGDEAAPTTTATATTQPATTTTDAPATTTTSTTSTTTTTASSTTAAPTTTTEADLEAQIAADYVRSWELRNELTSNPTLENLDARVAEIAAVGTPEFDALKAFIEELVALGERTAPNDPNIFSVTVESVTIEDAQHADVTFCYVDNRLRINANGESTGEVGVLVATRSTDSVALTDGGWLPDGDLRISWEGIGVTSCPPE